MPKPIISASNLSKCYHLGATASHNTMRDQIADRVRRIFRPTEKNSGDNPSEFWALKDVSFDVAEGEVLGVIGRNGAGKSTLLKVLSQITEPTSGEVRIRGRIASLLEVGTGFHPELSGRENIYLNGAILGMARAEIRKKFDEIVAFSEIERFLDTPVKRYSSGMYVRLAFAVAAHLEPKVLIVDEVLAVGDAQFQKKCLGKMEDVAKNGGRTVLFVSHNMNAIEQLCSSALLLEKGCVARHSREVRDIIADYLFGDDQRESNEWINPGNEYQNPWFFPTRIYIGNESGVPLPLPVKTSEDCYFYAEGKTDRFDNALTIGYAIYNEEGACLYISFQTDTEEELWKPLKKGRNILRTRLPHHLLNEGLYRIEFVGGIHNREWLYEPTVNAPAIHLHIQGGLSKSPYWTSRRRGILAPMLQWDINP